MRRGHDPRAKLMRETCHEVLGELGLHDDPLFKLALEKIALARTVGWIAQLNEMIADPEYKIGRPRQLFVGRTHRKVLPLHQRP